MSGQSAPLAAMGLDAVAVKPAERDLDAVDPATDAVVVDFEGRDHVPEPAALEALARQVRVRLTVPVRADGFDPLGENGRDRALPDAVERVLVAGHPAYLDETERTRAVAPRLGAAVERHPGAWVGTEGVERLALATGAAQFEVLSATTDREVRALRAAGFEGTLAVYAPTAVTTESDAILDAVGDYAARRPGVADRLPDGSPTDARATGAAREALLAACRDCALVGDRAAVAERIRELRDAGVDRVVGYPAGGPA